MTSNVFPLSSLNSSLLSSTLKEVEFKQYEKKHNGSIPFVFSECFSNSCDYKSKHYTDFILTKNEKTSNIFDFKFPTIDIEKFLTTIRDNNLYLSYVEVDERYLSNPSTDSNLKYKGCLFKESPPPSISNFTLDFFKKDHCKIKLDVKGIVYCLIYDKNQQNDLYFVNEQFLSKNDDIVQPHHFKFIYQENYSYITFFKDTPEGLRYLYRLNNMLRTQLITNKNKLSVLTSKFIVSRNKYLNYNLSLNSTFITYNNQDNSVDLDNSDLELKNNFLIHKKNSIRNSKSDITVLKNHFLPHIDQIANANNLLIPDKKAPNEIVVDNMRNYTSIFEDIQTEKNDDLSLNYVYHNKYYKINPGQTVFTSPEDMFPYTQLNINDTKFKECGAFSYPSPEFADKIYYYDNDVQINNNQHYLCTWLSGAMSSESATSENSIWVDRYYYPNRIDKRDALNGKSIFGKTYDEYVENYIKANSLGPRVDDFKFFDKKSDLVFKPNKKYIYERVSFPTDENGAKNICSSFISKTPTNYFKKINDSGEFTFVLYFYGNTAEWEVKSDRNEINAGITIQKGSKFLYITYSLYEPDSLNRNIYKTYSKRVGFKKFSENTIYIGFNSYTGYGYVIFNEAPLINIKEQAAKYAIKDIIFGDFFVFETDKLTSTTKKINLLNYDGDNISDNLILDYFYPMELVNSISVAKGKYKTNSMYITLPCGMRNGTDNIDLVHTICGNTSSKSNTSNILLKNIKISDETILENLKNNLQEKIKEVIPSTSNINIKIGHNYK